MQPPVIFISPNALMRKVARDALKPHWSTALMVALIAQLPMLLFNVADMMLGGAMRSDAMRVLEHAVASNTDVLVTVANEFLANHSATLMTIALIWVPAALLSPVLSMGQQHYTLQLLRGNAGQMSMVFSRMRWFFKALWQEIVIYVRVFLWSLLGSIPMFLGVLLLLLLPGEATLTIYPLLAMASTFLMIGLVVWNMMKYNMAYCILADDPTKGVGQSVRESVEMMRARKGQLLSLNVSFLGWVLLQNLGVNLIAMLAGTVIGNTLSMLTSLVLQVYMLTAVSVFYERCRRAKEKPAEESENEPAEETGEESAE